MCNLLRKRGIGSMPAHLGRALASVRAGAARLQGQARTMPRSALPQMVAPELEWELLRTVERAARRYRQAQQALADREAQGGGEAAFRAALAAVAQSHHQLDAALLEIRRYYEEAEVTVE
jgi:DNA-binding transcriptional regulator YdaS (Cro superfamily)